MLGCRVLRSLPLGEKRERESIILLDFVSICCFVYCFANQHSFHVCAIVES